MAVAELPRLLVVDDEEAICEGCRRILSRQGFAVDKVSDPREGLSRATADDYAAILLDIKMPEMSGLDFLSKLREARQDIPVILMTGFPSVPTAVSAISLGAAGYVTKPFTPEEITQAVHRFAHQGRTMGLDVSLPQETATVTAQLAPATPIKFWHDAWAQQTPESAYRCGAVLAGVAAEQVESVCLPKIGEVIYQGLPMAQVTTTAGHVRTVVAPLTGVVEAVNPSVAGDPHAVASDPCGNGWLAEIHATRDDDELDNCLTRVAYVLAGNAEVAETHMKRLRTFGCDTRALIGTRTGGEWEEMTQRLATEHDDVVLLDAASLGEEGPKMAAQINVLAPSAKIIVVASPECPWEAAYRSRRIFYYVVEPFESAEVMEVVNSAFAMPVVSRARGSRGAAMEPVAQIQITNRNGDDVVLLAAPGMLYRNTGLGAEIRGLIYDRLYPIQTIPGKASVAPRDLLNLAHKFDRVLLLESKDLERLPGTLVRDQGTDLATLNDGDSARVTTSVTSATTPSNRCNNRSWALRSRSIRAARSVAARSACFRRVTSCWNPT